MSDGWKRIPEDEIMLPDCHTFKFTSGGEIYSLSYDPSDIHQFTFKMGCHSETWSIEIQEVKGTSYRWQGMAFSDDWFPEGATWYEFTWDANPKILYGGDQVLVREGRMTEVVTG